MAMAMAMALALSALSKAREPEAEAEVVDPDTAYKYEVFGGKKEMAQIWKNLQTVDKKVQGPPSHVENCATDASANISPGHPDILLDKLLGASANNIELRKFWTTSPTSRTGPPSRATSRSR